ncbi:alpha/beta fold hydrolase [Kitasatospora sp. NPDC006697]|uniref:alpha/beta fold hydrolase n=1 Tax=Kitasatospora sp. NPDC006697 TaxID=3364020 RepID=UPI00367E176C
MIAGILEAGDAESPTLLLVHGAGQGGRLWQRQLAEMSGRFHLLAPDLPGFGATPGPFTLPAAVESLADLARRSGAPVHLCGHSLGAIVAAWLAAEHPELVARLVLVSGPELTPARTSARRLRVGRRRPGWLVRAGSDLRHRADWLRLLDALTATDLTGLLPRITAPTLVLCGQRDGDTLPDARRAAELIPGAQLVVVPQAGHLLPVTAPRAFGAIVPGFLLAKQVQR